MAPGGTDDAKQVSALNFPELESLRLFCKELLDQQVDSLKYFEYRAGYQHFKGKQPLKISVSSSVTCVLSLTATGLWPDNPSRTKTLCKYLLSRNRSAGLAKNNPFTIAWVLEAVTALDRPSLALGPPAKLARLETLLQDSIKSGGVRIKPYPPSPYLTQLVVRVLDARGKLSPKLREAVVTWAWAELAWQLALIQAKSKTADAFALAYLLMLVAAVTPSTKSDPEKTSVQRAALRSFFQCQREDGTWPLSRPLFHYPNYGNAYCYEYEMLVQLLQQPALKNLLLDYLPELRRAAESVAASVYRVEGGIAAWTSGHHPNLREPESWATASVYHFIHQLDRVLAEAVRRQLFGYLESPLPVIDADHKKRTDFATSFLDSEIRVKGRKRSLKQFLWDRFVRPLSEEAEGIKHGRKFGRRTPRSAIFFGPPGTSKTELSKEIAEFLGWPHLAIDPSFLLRSGMDAIQAESNIIFRMLEQTECVVVLFDEFDELVRERESSDAEALSRFLTTAMLPKLASIHKRATIVFILATNNIGEFDLAIRREGRFDCVVQIMPPTYEAKISKKDWGVSKIDVAAKLRALGINLNPPIREMLAELTFGEFDALATEIARVTDRKLAHSMLMSHWQRCTLQARVARAHLCNEGETTWKARCQEESIHSR